MCPHGPNSAFLSERRAAFHPPPACSGRTFCVASTGQQSQNSMCTSCFQTHLSTPAATVRIHTGLCSCAVFNSTHHISLGLVCTSGLMLGYLSEYLPVTSVYTACVCTWSGSSVYRRRTSRPLFSRPLVSLWSLCCCLGLWLHLRSGLKESTTHFCKKREKEQVFCCWDL